MSSVRGLRSAGTFPKRENTGCFGKGKGSKVPRSRSRSLLSRSHMTSKRITFPDGCPDALGSSPSVTVKTLPSSHVRDAAAQNIVSLQGKPGKPNPRAVNLVAHIQSNQKRRQRFHDARILQLPA